MPGCVEVTAPPSTEGSLRTQRRIIVCAGTGCAAGGAWKVLEAFRAMDVDASLSHDACPHRDVTKSGCQGFCQMGPLVTILPENIFYTKVTPADVAEIVGPPSQRAKPWSGCSTATRPHGKRCRGTDDIPFYTRQNRFVLKNCGYLDPESLDEYIAGGGYEALKRPTPHDAAGDLRAKSRNPAFAAAAAAASRRAGNGKLPACRTRGKKYVICNGDEGDPGAFMDRSVMEGNPHSVDRRHDHRRPRHRRGRGICLCARRIPPCRAAHAQGR